MFLEGQEEVVDMTFSNVMFPMLLLIASAGKLVAVRLSRRKNCPRVSFLP